LQNIPAPYHCADTVLPDEGPWEIDWLIENRHHLHGLRSSW